MLDTMSLSLKFLNHTSLETQYLEVMILDHKKCLSMMSFQIHLERRALFIVPRYARPTPILIDLQT